MGAVLVCGATGTTGGEVLRQLRQEGRDVRAMTRSADSAAELGAKGVEAVLGDLGDPASLAAALAGVEAVYVASPSSPEIAEHEGNLARAAAAAGVGTLVKLSVIGASPESPIMFGRLHAAAEAQIRAAGVPWTMVRPNGFMQNTLQWAPQVAAGAVHAPVMDARWAIVDVRDIAAVAVAALTEPDRHAGESYTVTGPAPVSPREEVAILAEVLGREIEAHDVPIEAAKQGMAAAGMPAWYVERLGELFGLYADGLAEAVSPEAEQVTGRPARDYRAFAEDHRALFAAGS